MHKPFECVGEVEESVAAVRMLREQEAWRDHVVVRELGQWIEEHLPEGDGRAEDVLAVGAEHFVPERLLEQIHACFGP